VQELEDEYKKESIASQRLTERGSHWLKNKKVKNLKDLDSEQHSLNSPSRTSLSLGDAKQENVEDLPIRNGKSESLNSVSVEEVGNKSGTYLESSTTAFSRNLDRRLRNL
jgi:hypothetical protein